VPDGTYLLNKTTINSDARTVNSSQLRPFLRQQPNSSMLLLGRVRLQTYNIPNNDSTWLSRRLINWGEPPVLFSEQLTAISTEQIRLHLINRGYLSAEVDTAVILENRKANVTYNITANEPHRISSIRDSIQYTDTTIFNIIQESRRTVTIREGDIFDRQVLEDGRIRLTNLLRNRGYFNLQRDDFVWYADTTTVDSLQVSLAIGLRPTTENSLTQYTLGNVTVISGVPDAILQDSTQHFLLDTATFRGVQIVSERNQFLRPRAIYYNTFLRPGRLYSDRVLDRTQASLNMLGPVSQAQILPPVSVERNDSNFLDYRIIILQGNPHFTQFSIDGTNSAGDLGISTNAIYAHRNFLKGGETFRVRLNAAYEFISSSDSLAFIDQSYFEYGVETSLAIPQLLLPWLMQRLHDRPSASTEFSIGANFQKRPEYLRQFFSLSTQFRWQSSDWRIQNTIEPVGITYIRMPYTSDTFDSLFVNNPILRYSYSEQSIVRTAYNINYTNISRIPGIAAPAVPIRVRAGAEVAGWIPRIISGMGGSQTNGEGFKTVFGTPYAEYVKSDLEFAIPFINIDDRNSFAARVGLGIAVPYGNSTILPFERRYFSGGASSVRGWNTRTLGPGSYQRPPDIKNDFINQVGDIKFDFGVEYRHRMTSLFELATYIDTGNIWTIRDYDNQPGGLFRWNEFYKEIAASYGVGLRLNFGFLLVRFDTGMKAYNPALPQGERWTISTPSFRRDFAFHFAIGYPF
jgi:outer membrane protein assembly factor BamA